MLSDRESVFCMVAYRIFSLLLAQIYHVSKCHLLLITQLALMGLLESEDACLSSVTENSQLPLLELLPYPSSHLSFCSSWPP